MADDFSAVMDAEETAVDTVVDAGDSGEGEALPALDAKTDTTALPDAKTDWRKVPAELKEFFKTPAGKPAADAWFARAGWHDKFPGGTKEADEILGFLNEHGGREGLSTAIQDFTAKAQELETIQERIANADPALLSDLPPESIGKLGPAFLAEYSKADFDGYNAQLSGVFAQTIAQSGIPMDLERADIHIDLLRDAIQAAGLESNPAIVRAFNGIMTQMGKFKEFTGSFAKIASTPVQTKQKPELDAREQTINQREQEAFNSDFRNKVDSFRAPLIANELKAFIAKAPSDEDKRELAMNEVRAKVIARMSADKDYQAKLTAFTKRKDTAGAMKLLESRERMAIQEIAPKVGRTIYGSVEAPKAVVAKPAATLPRATPKVPVAGRFEDRVAAIWDS